jgi:hypothetical protein
MARDDEFENNKTYRSFRAGLDMGMGMIYVCFGGGIIYLKAFVNMDLGPKTAYTIGGLMVAYGLFRLWRGVRGFGKKG